MTALWRRSETTARIRLLTCYISVIFLASVDKAICESIVTLMKITVYLRQNCRWSEDVCDILEKYGLSYTSRDVVADTSFFDEMVRKSGQKHAPCVEIDGVMLGDVCGEDVENYLLSHELVRAIPYENPAPVFEPEEGKHVINSRINAAKRFF